MRRTAGIALMVAALWSDLGRVEAGPWVPGRWHFYLQLRQSVMIADRRYDADGHLQGIQVVVDDARTRVASGYRQALTSLYFELGLGTRLSVAVDLMLLDFVAQPLAGRAARTALGVSDLRFLGKLLLFDDELTAAILLGLVAPTGSATSAVPLGPGDVRADLSVLIGKLFERPRIHVAAELGVAFRSSATIADPAQPGARTSRQYSHALRYGVTLGHTWAIGRRGADAFAISAKLEGAYAFARPVEDGLGLLVAEAASYTKLGPELVWSPTRHWQLSLGGSYFVAGRTIPAMGELALGLAFLR